MIKRVIFLLAVLILPVVGALDSDDFERIVIDSSNIGEGLTLHKIDHNTFLAGYRIGNGASNENFRIMRTTDSFTTTDLVFEGSSTASHFSKAIFGANLTHIFFLYNDGTGGNDLKYVTSSDDGETWSSPQSTGTSEERPRDLQFMGGDSWLMMSDFSIRRSDDNFATFRSQGCTTSIACWAGQINNTEYFVWTSDTGGSDRGQWHTCSDDGSSFTCTSPTKITGSGVPAHVHDIEILDEDSWVAVGMGSPSCSNCNDGKVFRTDNAGSSWSILTYDGSDDLHEFIIGESLHEFNGSKWHVYNRGRQNNEESVRLVGFNAAYTSVNVANGLILETTNAINARDSPPTITDNKNGLIILTADTDTNDVVIYRESEGGDLDSEPTSGRLFDDDSFIFGGNKTDMASDIKVTEAGLEALYGAITIIVFLAIGASAAGGFGAMGGGILGSIISSQLGWLPAWAGFFMAAICMAVFSIVRKGGGD